MEKNYNHKEAERRINLIWQRNNFFIPKIDLAKKPFSIFLTPPNASGEMHIGNALMIAIQDIMARYHRAKGKPTLWLPSTDHGGYETQVTFERELEKIGMDRLDYGSKELFEVIERFVECNNEIIKNQIKSLGASVDWSKFRYTMDNDSVNSTNNTFTRMVANGLIYRQPYMVYYCPACATILADIELKEKKEKTPLYFIKFYFENGLDYLPLATTRPEFIFSATHVLIHPSDESYAGYIGKILVNPITGKPVEIISSNRKFDSENAEPFLAPFSPSYKKFDYEYTLRHSLPAQNLLDWNGRMLERYPGVKPAEARAKEVLFLTERGLIENIDESYIDSIFYCKRGHAVEAIIMFTWFLKLDDKKISLRKNTFEAINKQGLTIYPKWREKGLMDWLNKMTDWPIARQNVWGIKIPIWYEISDSTKFTVWFIDKTGERRCGNLKSFLDGGVTIKEVSVGLERIYAAEDAAWTLEKKPGKFYLPETDTFDTWFSSGQWATIVFGDYQSENFTYFYPADSIVIGHDLLRLSVSRKLLLSVYLTGRLPFNTVYLHRLILGPDGQKMSKSIGNTVSLECYLEKYGADVTRLALISYTVEREDFILEEERLARYQNFAERLWQMGRIIKANQKPSSQLFKRRDFSREDNDILFAIDNLAQRAGSSIEKFSFALAQEKLCNFLAELEKYLEDARRRKNKAIALSVLNYAFKKYLAILHPFMPFMTEELCGKLYNSICPLAANPLPDKMSYFGK